MDTQALLPESREQLLSFLDEIRRSIIRILLLVGILTVPGYILADDILRFLKGRSGVELAAFGVAETFFTFLYLALAFGLFASFPYMVYRILAALKPLSSAFSGRRLFFFWLSAVILFYAGALFCLDVALAYGIRFLLGFGTGNIKAVISVQKYVTFILAFVFGFGAIFELPLVMIVLGRIGILKGRVLARYRRYAALLVVILSAILTPTPDVFNMMLMAVPLYLLFEIGLMGMRLAEKKPIA